MTAPPDIELTVADAASSFTGNKGHSLPPASDPPSETESLSRGFRFWLVFLGIGISTMITGLELSAISVALPTIVEDLHGSGFVWVGSAYALAATAIIPLCGGLAQVLGRRVVIMSSLLIMTVGSILCAVAKSMNFLVAGRTVQGLGGGGIAATTAIIISDLVPLQERGVFNGLIGIAWAVSSGAGPLIGGALAQNGQWRWLFYLNIPICGIAGALMLLFLRVRTPPGTVMEKLARLDWFGNGLVIAATASCVIALTWSGIQYTWSSIPVIVPLALGLIGLVAFLVYDALVPRFPLVPFVLMSTRTGISGYTQTFITPIILTGITYYMSVYFQACLDASPIGSGVDALAFALVAAPAGIVSGVSVKKTGRYRPQLWLSWIFVLLGTGMLMTLHADTPKGHSLGFVALEGIGVGILSTTTYFPVLAPLPVSHNGPALAFFMFFRNFAQVWGITIGGAVLQNQLNKRLPVVFLSQFPQGSAVAYATIPLIKALDEPLKMEVRVAFAESLKIVWAVLLGIAGLGLLASLAMHGLPLHDTVDEDWMLEKQDASTPEAEQRGMNSGKDV